MNGIDDEDLRGGSTRSAIAPPHIEEIAAIATAMEKLRDALEGFDGVSEGYEQYLRDWSEVAIHQNTSEEWIGSCVAFVLRRELRAVRHNVSGDKWRAATETRGTSLYDKEVRAVIASRPDIEQFIDDCLSRVSCFLPGRTDAQQATSADMRKRWREGVIDAIRYEVGEWHLRDPHGPMECGVLKIEPTPERPGVEFWNRDAFGPLYVANDGQVPARSFSARLLDNDRCGIAVIVPAIEQVPEDDAPRVRSAVAAYLRDLADKFEANAVVEQPDPIVRDIQS